jgi:probable selenium-dependent hydroxylase accessory protein YqeC
LRLYEALGIGPGDIVAFAGAGGKSSAIAEICRELSEAGMTALAVPTTKLFVSEADGIGRLVTAEEPAELYKRVSDASEELPEGPGGGGTLVAGSGHLSKDRVSGVEAEQVPDLATLVDVTLVEADGSRRRSLKGTAAHEPAMPEGVTLAVAVGGSRVLGAPLNGESVHRPELFSGLTGILSGQSITPKAFAVALAKGSLGNIPDDARRAVLLTGVEPGPRMSSASSVARELWRLGIQRVVLTSLPAEGPAMIWTA